MLGIRCQGEDAGHTHCLNPRCECPRHAGDTARAERIKEAKNRGRKHGKHRSVYHMDHPEEGDTYEFTAQ